LSGHPQTEVPLPEQFGDVLVTRAELEDLIRQNLLRSTRLLTDTVRTAGLMPDRLAGIYLVGGSSRIPLVATMIAEQLRIVPTNLDQPETAVALGALHVAQAGTSLRTEALAEERTTHIAPPVRPPARPAAAPRPPVPIPPVRPLSRPQVVPVTPPPPARGGRAPWLVGAALVGVLAVAGIVVAVANSGGGDRTAAPQTTATTDRATEEPTTTTPTTTTTSLGDVVVGHPKKIAARDCGGLLTAGDVSSAFGTSAVPIDRDPCGFWLNYPGEQPGSLYLEIASSLTSPEKVDHNGNTAYQNDDRVETVDTDGARGSAPQCVVSLAVTEHDFVNVKATVYRDSATDLCDKVWPLVDTAFGKLPDA
jgi:hypothetical protein